MVAEIRRRLGDYDGHDVVAERNKLIEKWKAAHPASAAEPPSAAHRTLMQVTPGTKDIKNNPEIWVSDIYQVTVRRWPNELVFHSHGGLIQIGIHALDGTARHDWREFQGIKNQIAGDECEGFELYPAESRLLDPSNYYTLWCFPGVKRIKVGVDEPRRVWDANESLAPQRAFEK